MPSRYFLAKSQLLSDMLYWEWQVDNIQFRVLESNNGMILWIVPNDFDPQKGISGKECAETLLKTTRIKCKDTDELCERFKLPSILREGDVFTNIDNFEKLVNAKIIDFDYKEFPMPTDPEHWSKQLVGFISKDGICLILVHGQFPMQSFPTIPDYTHRWLSGRILHKDTKTPVLPRGVKQMPESWKPVLEDNAKKEKWALEMAEKSRIEEAKWRVWHDKNGKQFYDGLKMRFWYWDKRPSDFMKSFFNATNDYPAASYREGTVVLEYRYVDKKFGFHATSEKYIPLSQFCNEDKKLIMAVPPQEWKPPSPAIALPSPEQQPKEPEPEEDDIE
jgi:hypothetical protein